MTTPAGATFTIDFGDGSAPETGVVSNEERRHLYPRHGLYTVTVTNEQSGKSSTRQVTVGDPQAAPEFTVAATPTPRQVRALVTYPDTDTFTIDFGDGTPSVTGVAPNDERLHTYAVRGTYTVTVTSTTGGKSFTRNITVEDPEAAPEFTVVPTGAPREAKLTITYPL